MATRVVNVRRESFDVYIGRGKCPKTGRPGDWGNPWSKKRHGLRSCLEQFLAMIEEQLQDPLWLPRAKVALRGKTLGCWCKPALCHGDVLARLVDGEPWRNVRRWAIDELDRADSGRQLVMFAQETLGATAVGDPEWH